MKHNTGSFTSFENRHENYMPRISTETYVSIANRIPHDNDYLQSLVIQGSELDSNLFIGLNLVNSRFGEVDDQSSKTMFSNTPYRTGFVVGYEVLRLAVLKTPEYFTEALRDDVIPIRPEEIEEITKFNFTSAMSIWADLRKLFPSEHQKESVYPSKERINYDLGAREIYLSVKRIVSNNY